jgi:hypothetical protein
MMRLTGKKIFWYNSFLSSGLKLNHVEVILTWSSLLDQFKSNLNVCWKNVWGWNVKKIKGEFFLKQMEKNKGGWIEKNKK